MASGAESVFKFFLRNSDCLKCESNQFLPLTKSFDPYSVQIRYLLSQIQIQLNIPIIATVKKLSHRTLFTSQRLSVIL